MKKNALLVGSSFSAAPLFFRLKSRPLNIHVCGSLEGDPCHFYSDVSHYIDYSNKESLLDLVKSIDIDYLIPSCNDYSYMASSWVAEHLGFPGFDSYQTAEILHNKHLFRAFTYKHGLPIPKFMEFKFIDSQLESLTTNLKFPVLVKPVDSFSGRGVTKAYDINELKDAIAHAKINSRSEQIILEEYVDGPLYSHSAFIKDRNIVFDVFANEYCTVYPYQVNCSHHPSSLGQSMQGRIREAINELAELLELKDGLLHTQLICNEDKFWIIECMRRGPGDLYGHMIEKSTGVDYTDLLIRPYIAEPYPLQFDNPFFKNIGRHTISAAQPFIQQSFSLQLASTYNTEIVALKNSGEPTREAPYDKLAILFTEFKTKDELFKLVPEFDSHVTINTF